MTQKEYLNQYQAIEGYEQLGKVYLCECGNFWTIADSVPNFCNRCGQRLRGGNELFMQKLRGTI